MDIIQKAFNVAVTAHRGQTDKGGHPYILHPLTIAMKMETEEEQAAALLHDVVEDAAITIDEIKENFGPGVATIVEILTRKKDETYMDYIARIKMSKNGAAVKIKTADLMHNSDLNRISNPSKKDINRIKRYEKALSILKAEA